MNIDWLCRDGSPLGVSEKSLYGEDDRIGVGGSEMAMLTLCRAFHDVGHKVRLYNSPKEKNASAFEQLPTEAFDPNDDRDVLITFRTPNEKSIVAKGLKVWMSCDQYTSRDFKPFAPHMDKIVVISDFHKEYFKNTYQIYNTTVIDLPVRLNDIDGFEVKKVPKKCMFTSVPDRGLMDLYRMWDSTISVRDPEASLVITSDYRLWGVDERNTDHRARWLFSNNVSFLGAVPRRQLIREQLSSQLLVYPSVYDELFCVYGDNLVRTVGGTKPAKYINVGDYVLNGLGEFSRILKKYVWITPKQRYQITSFGNQQPLEVTRDHKVLAIRKRRCGYEPISKKFKLKSSDCIPEWINAEDLVVGDILLYKYPSDVIDKKVLNISSYVKNLEQIGDTLYQTHNHADNGITYKKVGYDDIIEITPEFLSLVGYYIAEGSTSRGAIQFAFHKDELSTLGEEVKQSLLNIFGLQPNEQIRGNSLAIWASSTSLARFFELLCGHGAKNKHMPEWVVTLPTEKQLDLIISMIRGDGHVTISKNKNSVLLGYTSSSHSLIYQLRDVLARLNICSSVKYRASHNSYQLVAGGDQILPIINRLGIDWKPTRKSSKHMWIHDGYIHMPIRKIENYLSFESTYDFTVDKEPSFVANGKIVHNCVSVAEAEACGMYTITSDTGALPTTNMGTVIPRSVMNYPSTFAHKVVELLNDPNLPNMQREIRQKAVERFSVDNIMKQWDEKVFK